MIPKSMEAFLRKQLPKRTWENRLVRDGGMCTMEFSALDVDRLARLGIEVDDLGPRQVVCFWSENTPLEVGGYLVIDNLAMGRPAMGGIRIYPGITPAEVFSLARGMTLKNAAAKLPYGGGKVGVVAERSLTPEEHTLVVREVARILNRYNRVFLPGPDVGTTDADMETIAIENGLDNALSKPARMGGVQIDEVGATAGGLVIALQGLLGELPRLKELSLFAELTPPEPGEITVLIQGFGAVGAHLARMLPKKVPGVKVVGVSDALGYLYDQNGVPVDQLFALWQQRGHISRDYYSEVMLSGRWGVSGTKYCSAPDDLLRESAFCLIPASPVARYLDIERLSTGGVLGKWQLILEGANTYSPTRLHRTARMRLEQELYRRRGVLIATDFLVNSGGVIYAAQEHLIKTPETLRLPDQILGNRKAVERWLEEHQAELAALADSRQVAAEEMRRQVIHNNMVELVDLLLSDEDMLPCEAAERISIRRVARVERNRCAGDLMLSIPLVDLDTSIQEAANLLTTSNSSILAVQSADKSLEGVITNWDITQAVARGRSLKDSVESIITRQVIYVSPEDTLIEVMRKLEHYEISAMPVVGEKGVLGMISADILARNSLLGLMTAEL